LIMPSLTWTLTGPPEVHCVNICSATLIHPF
jgi:hypothetical protein